MTMYMYMRLWAQCLTMHTITVQSNASTQFTAVPALYIVHVGGSITVHNANCPSYTRTCSSTQ